MAINITLPEIGSPSKTSKDAVISVLSQKWPLCAKEIHFEIQKILENGSSYQATHKIIKQLVGEGVLTKDGKNYGLSLDWILKLKKFSGDLKENYSKNSKKFLINPDFAGTVKWFFDDVSVFTVEIARLFAGKALVGGGESVGVGLLRHAWWPLNFKFIDFALVIDIMKNNGGGYAIIQHDTPFDRWIARQYESANFSGVKLGVKDLNLSHDIVIHGDSIVQVNYSGETKKFLDEIYSRNSHLGDLFKEFVNQTASKHKARIEVTITKNPALAHTMRTQLIEKFFEGQK